ncbi:SCO family protein [Cesiribacter sp. SM1]|uniref:SCO family protein n=1 Tax=Cesiribacter sp. SM1 TaxID=2861196 RepID=UPI001CD45904|nr:SCO family protein [Cesiribacter sp. SM1]
MKLRYLIPALALSVACSGNKHEMQHEHAQHQHVNTAEAGLHEHGAHAAGEAMLEPSDASIYNLDSRWVSHTGDSINLHTLQGRVQLVAMVYTACEYACPRIVADMKRIEEAVVDTWGHQVGFVLVSIDPKHDTPEKLREFARKNGFNPHRWQLLHGSEGNILELAALLGVQYKKVGEKDFSHSNVITVLDAAGEIKHQQLGLGVKPDETIAAIQQLLIKQMEGRSLKHH